MKMGRFEFGILMLFLCICVSTACFRCRNHALNFPECTYILQREDARNNLKKGAIGRFKDECVCRLTLPQRRILREIFAEARRNRDFLPNQIEQQTVIRYVEACYLSLSGSDQQLVAEIYNMTIPA